MRLPCREKGCPCPSTLVERYGEPKAGNERTVMYATVDAILKQKGSRVWTIPGDVNVFEAIQLMAARNIGALVVVSANKLEGIFTERDYTRKVALYGKSHNDTFVSDIISHQICV